MTVSRHKAWRRFGASLAGLALYIQLAFAGWSMLQAAAVDPGDGLGAHALCLAGGAEQNAPGQPTPAVPAHDHAAFCCLWHVLPAVTPPAAAAVHPVAYARLGREDCGDAVFVPGLRHGPANARAPPPLA